MNFEDGVDGIIFESLIIDAMNQLEVVNDSMTEGRRVKVCLGAEFFPRHVQSQINLLLRLTWKVIDVDQLFVGFAQLANLLGGGQCVLSLYDETHC